MPGHCPLFPGGWPRGVGRPPAVLYYKVAAYWRHAFGVLAFFLRFWHRSPGAPPLPSPPPGRLRVPPVGKLSPFLLLVVCVGCFPLVARRVAASGRVALRLVGNGLPRHRPGLVWVCYCAAPVLFPRPCAVAASGRVALRLVGNGLPRHRPGPFRFRYSTGPAIFLAALAGRRWRPWRLGVPRHATPPPLAAFGCLCLAYSVRKFRRDIRRGRAGIFGRRRARQKCPYWPSSGPLVGC